VVMHAHSERGYPRRDLASDLAEPDDPNGRLVERAQTRDTWPVGVRSMGAVERPAAKPCCGQPVDRDQSIDLSCLLCQHEHQHYGVLGTRDIGASPQRQDFDAF
jgi:hypothetical protein